MMHRRAVLNLLAGTAAVGTCPLCLTQAAQAAESKTHWGYESHEGPAHWAELNGDYAVCGTGGEQSPIDLAGRVPAVLSDLSIDWRDTKLAVLNNGHTIQVNTEPGSAIALKGKRFDLKQFHFHHRSEHTVDGRSYDMEIHFVHAAADGNLAVLGVFVEPGDADDTIARIWDTMPSAVGDATADTRIAPGHLLPARRSFYRYAGSLTTPPCSEIVTWTVYAEPITLSQAQIDAFAALYPANARPVQALNRRVLLGNF